MTHFVQKRSSNSFTQMAVILLFSSASPNADLQVNGANGRLFVGEPRLRTQPKSGQRVN